MCFSRPFTLRPEYRPVIAALRPAEGHTTDCGSQASIVDENTGEAAGARTASRRCLNVRIARSRCSSTDSLEHIVGTRVIHFEVVSAHR